MGGNGMRGGLLGFAGGQTLDLAGPLDALASANSVRPAAYLTLTASLNGAPFASESGLRIAPDGALRDMGPIDTLIVPGGAALRRPAVYEETAEAVMRISAGCRRIVSVCTRIYGVAPTGLLDGRRATTHLRFAHDVATRFPA